MRCHQPVHPAADIAVLARPEGQVEVIGHKAISEDAHRSANTRLGHQVEERVGIVGLLKHNRPRVPPIEDMIRVTSQAGPSGSGHGVATGVQAGADTPILSKTSNKLAMSPFPLSLEEIAEPLGQSRSPSRFYRLLCMSLQPSLQPRPLCMSLLPRSAVHVLAACPCSSVLATYHLVCSPKIGPAEMGVSG